MLLTGPQGPSRQQPLVPGATAGGRGRSTGMGRHHWEQSPEPLGPIGAEIQLRVAGGVLGRTRLGINVNTALVKAFVLINNS